MHHARTLLWIVVLVAGTGLLEHAAAVDDGTGLHLLAGLGISYLCFLWYCADSDARGFVRSRWLSVGLAAFALGGIPYYLLRSRRDGERGLALMMGYAACLALVALAVYAAMHIASIQGGHGMPTPR